MAPVCIVVLCREKSEPNALIAFISPKHLRPLVDDFTIVIEPNDQRSLTVQNAIEDPSIWSKLMWGNTRDLQLIKKLKSFPSLKKLGSRLTVRSQRGIIFGDRKKPAPYFEGRRLFDKKFFPTESVISFETDDFPVVEDIMVHSRDSTNLEAFSWPQLIVKLSWNKSIGRFQARLNISQDETGILCNQSYVSVHTKQSVLEAACVSHNSKVAMYFYFLTSGTICGLQAECHNGQNIGLAHSAYSAGRA